jgi:VPDSG-CTERM motif
MKTLIVGAIRCSLMFLVTASLFSVRPAQGYTITLQQVGSNVVANGSGAINLTGLTFVVSGTLEPGVIVPNIGIIQIGGSLGNPFIDQYIGITGPTSFGSGDAFEANTNSGDFVGIFGLTGNIDVPQGYVSDTPLSDSMTFNNATFASLFVTPGTYIWTWGTGGSRNFTLQIGSVGVPGVPDGGSTVFLLGCALLGLTVLRRKLSC